MGVAHQQVGVTRTIAEVFINAEGQVTAEVAVVREAACVAEAVALEGLGLVAEVDAGYKAGEEGVEALAVADGGVLDHATLEVVVVTQAQLGGEAAPTLLGGHIDVGFEGGAVRNIRLIGHVVPVARRQQAVADLAVAAVTIAQFGAGLDGDVVLQRQGVVHAQFAASVEHVAHHVAAEVGEGGGVVVSVVVGVATVGPVVAVEGYAQLAAGGVVAVGTMTEAVVEGGVEIAEVAARGLVLNPSAVAEERILVPIGVSSHPSRKGGLVIYLPVGVEPEVAALIGHLVHVVVRHEAACVAVVVEEGRGAVIDHVVVAEIAAEIDVEVDLLVGPHVGEPRTQSRSGCTFHADAEQLVARNLLIGYNINNAAGCRVAG